MNTAPYPTPDTQHPTPSPSPSYKWTVVGMLWFICFFNYADRVAISSVGPILRSKFNFTAMQFGIISSAFMWVYAGAAPFAGRAGDIFSRKAVIIGGLYVWSLVTGLTGLCGKFWQFVAVRATEGLGETFYIPASVSLISDYHGPETRSRAIGIQQTSIYAGTVFGGALAGWMAVNYGWQTPFLFLGAAGILLGIVLARFIREPKRGEAELPDANVAVLEGAPMPHTAWPGPPPVSAPSAAQMGFGAIFGLLFGILLGSVLAGLASKAIPQPIYAGVTIGVALGLIFARRLWSMFGAICTSKTALLLLLGFVGTNSVFSVFMAWAPTYLHDVFAVPISRAGLLATAPIQVGSMVGAMIGGLLADRLRRTMKGGRIFVQGVGTLLGIPFLVLCGMNLGLGMALAALACFGVAKGIHDANISAGIFDVVRVESRSAAIGLLNFVGWGAGAIWTIWFGAMVDRKVPMGTLISYNAGIYAFVCLVFFYAALARAPKDVIA
jgi:MFS family permease